ncbi:restriction endonuclease subunit S [Teredinibacter turnerae]|uniref:restriction endonuclease subunit S n=1 Tax=Teredinibacter turnerae TaxID=2426 RepID=UPI000363EA3A|nr:restriction endonuclease subunit S [Teredinibacter turnerae]
MSYQGNASGWPLVPLKDVATLKRGYDLPVSQREDGDIPIYAANGPNGTHNEAKVTGPGVITGRSGTIGKVHFSESDYWPLNTSLYVTNFHGNEPRWVFYLLKAFRLERFSEGAGVPTLNRNLVHDELIPLPPLTEQKRIAAILDKADAIRRKRQQAIQLADEFLRSVFLDMFGDPVTNPKGWEVRQLGELADFENGDRSSNYPSGDEIVQSGVLFLSTKNIVSDNLNLRSTQYITEEKYNSLSRGKARKGDLIITLRGTLGSCCIFDCEYDRAFINAQMMIIRPLDNIRGIFLHDLLASKAIKSHFQSIGQGAAVPQLTAKQLKEILIPLPQMDLQIKYETARTAALSVLEKMSISLGKGLFEALSQKAFSGEL